MYHFAVLSSKLLALTFRLTALGLAQNAATLPLSLRTNACLVEFTLRDWQRTPFTATYASRHEPATFAGDGASTVQGTNYAPERGEVNSILALRSPTTLGSTMTSATIKLFLPRGDAKSLRTAEISNWTGKAISAPRTELKELLAREELEKAGLYILLGNDPITNAPSAYIGEAEIIRDRLKQHKDREFSSAIVFVSKDENLTKAHVRYLESRVLAEAAQIGRFKLDQNQAGGSRLPESDREDMEVFLARIRQLLPVLGTDILSPIVQPSEVRASVDSVLYCRSKGAEARGQRTAGGFVVFQGSTAVILPRRSAENAVFITEKRRQLIEVGTLVERDGLLWFTRNTEFTSPSGAASIVQGGHANGLIAWKNKDGKTLKQLDDLL